MTDNRGFTLVELISVVLILSVLALIVYPSYRNYVEKAKINAVRAALLENAHLWKSFICRMGDLNKHLPNGQVCRLKRQKAFVSV